GPVYLSFDIDAVDPAFAPATGTPEVGGLTSYEALVLVRALAGLNIVGADVVEVSPPYDGPGQITALLAANLLFEIASLLALQKCRGWRASSRSPFSWALAGLRRPRPRRWPRSSSRA